MHLGPGVEVAAKEGKRRHGSSVHGALVLNKLNRVCLSIIRLEVVKCALCTASENTQGAFFDGEDGILLLRRRPRGCFTSCRYTPIGMRYTDF